MSSRPTSPLRDALGRLRSSSRPARPGTICSRPTCIGYLVGLISGMPFADFVRTRILRPLGMLDTDFFVPVEKAARFADCYVKSADGRLAPAPARDYGRTPPRAFGWRRPSSSTAADYLRFCEMLRSGGALGDVRLLGPKTLAADARQSPARRPRSRRDVGLDVLGVDLPGRRLRPRVRDDDRSDPGTAIASSPGEYWWGGMASTAFWVDALEDVCVVFMTQLIPSSTYPIRRELRTMVNAVIVDSKGVAPSDELMASNPSASLPPPPPSSRRETAPTASGRRAPSSPTSGPGCSAPDRTGWSSRS